jgi:NitT/TauT family transport system ATP-binding protein
VFLNGRRTTASWKRWQGVGLEQFAKSYPRELSGGMKMRVSIARALVTKPKLLLDGRALSLRSTKSHASSSTTICLHLWETFGWTVVFVTHSVFESVYLSDRIVVMAARPGRVVNDMAIDAPYPRDESPSAHHPFTAASAATSPRRCIRPWIAGDDHVTHTVPRRTEQRQ